MKIIKKLINFLKGIVTEVKKVEWIKLSLATRYTLMITLFIVLGTLFIFGADKLITLAKNLII